MNLHQLDSTRHKTLFPTQSVPIEMANIASPQMEKNLSKEWFEQIATSGNRAKYNWASDHWQNYVSKSWELFMLAADIQQHKR